MVDFEVAISTSVLQNRSPLKIVDAALLPNPEHLHNLWTPSLEVVGL